MPYPEEMVQPMRSELTFNGFIELKTPEEVDSILSKQEGTTLVVVNSVCGCAAGQARPGVLRALAQGKKPNTLATVFAGQDVEATDKARQYFTGYRPSSPSIGLMKNGELVFFMERSDIENRSAEMIADVLGAAFEIHCS